MSILVNSFNKKQNSVAFIAYQTEVVGGTACGSLRSDAGQCTNGCGFDSQSACARLPGASMLCIGFPQTPLRLASISTVPRNVSFSSAQYLSCFHTRNER